MVSSDGFLPTAHFDTDWAAVSGPGGANAPLARMRGGLRADEGRPAARSASAYSVLTTTVRMTLSAKVWPFASHAGHR